MDHVADGFEGYTLEDDEGNVIEDRADDDTMLFDDGESSENEEM